MFFFFFFFPVQLEFILINLSISQNVFIFVFIYFIFFSLKCQSLCDNQVTVTAPHQSIKSHDKVGHSFYSMALFPSNLTSCFLLLHSSVGLSGNPSSTPRKSPLCFDFSFNYLWRALSNAFSMSRYTHSLTLLYPHQLPLNSNSTNLTHDLLLSLNQLSDKNTFSHLDIL